MADRQQGFFDVGWCSELLSPDSTYVLLAAHGDRIVRDEDFADCYSERHGRPSIPPSLGARKSMLQAGWTAVLVNLHPIGAALRTEAA